MDFAWVGDIIKMLPPQMQTVVALAVLGLAYKYIDGKRKGGEEPADAVVSARLEELELHVTNHLTTSIGDLATAITALTEATRDAEEQSNRVAATSNVILTKMDIMRDMLIRIDGRGK
jgi:hypothetical protein